MTPLSRPLRQTTRKMMKKDKLGRPRNNNQNAGRNGLPRDDGDGGEELTAPSYLGEVGCAAWKQAATMMRSRGILDSSDALALEMCISAYEEYRAARELVMGEGMVITTTSERGHEVQRKHPAISAMNSAWSRCKSLIHELGLTPKSGLGGKAEDDPFDRLLRDEF